MKVSDYIAKFLVDVGVRHVFTVPGGNSMYLNDAIGHHPKIEAVSMLHEQSAAIAAEAYAVASGGIGVCCITSGPGATNAITGCLAAWTGSTPVLFISGQVKSSDIRPDLRVRTFGNQESPIVSMIAPITKFSRMIRDPRQVVASVKRAIATATSDRPGPAWLDIPLDVQNADIDPDQSGGGSEGPVEISRISPPEVVDKILSLIERSFRPVILAGNGIHLARAEESFRRMVETLKIPVVSTRQGVDLLPFDHPLNAGVVGSIGTRYGNWAMQESDLLLILGARMDNGLIAYAPEKLAPCATKIMVDIDMHEIAKLAPYIDMPITADVGCLIEAVNGRKAVGHWSGWQQRIDKWKSCYPMVQPKHRGRSPVSIYEFGEVLSEAAAESDIILPGASGDASEIALNAFRIKAGQRMFHNKGTGAMGFSQPAAIGASLATGRRVICVDGDGGFQMNVQDLQTIAARSLNVKMFVINNGGYASIRRSQQSHFKRTCGADKASGLSLPNVQKIGPAFGIPTWLVDNHSLLRASIRRALATSGPVICEIIVEQGEVKEPCVRTNIDKDGKIRSGSLEQMWPNVERPEYKDP